jgi:hypothetical protein
MSACDTLRTEFSAKLRPRILRLAKKHFHWSNWYHATLKRQQGSSKHPSPGDLSKTYRPDGGLLRLQRVVQGLCQGHECCIAGDLQRQQAVVGGRLPGTARQLI